MFLSQYFLSAVKPTLDDTDPMDTEMSFSTFILEGCKAAVLA